MGDGLGQLLLGVQVALAAYHDALSLGRTGAVLLTVRVWG